MYATRLALGELNQSSIAKMETTGNPRFATRYIWSIAVVGWVSIVFSVFQLQLSRLDLRLLILAMMVAISTQVAVRIPRVTGRITLGDTFLFLTILLYGGEAAVLMGAFEGVCSTLTISRKPRTILFNGALLGISTFLSVTALRLLFGSPTEIVTAAYSANFLVAICTMALVQYLTNTGLIAVEKSYKIDESIWQTWKKYYLWTSITYFAGASAAGIIAHLIRVFVFYAVLATVPIVLIIYFTYDIYLKNLEASEAQAGLAQRHVEELSRYVADLTRSEEQLIDDLLDVSRIISGKLHLDVRPIDLSSVTEAAINVARPAADAKSIQLTYSHPTILRTISGDFARLQQVAWNLLSNAVKFTPEGGRIEVRLEYTHSHVKLTVADTGKGISKDFLPYVFDRFRQADSSTTRVFGGLGLGLAIVRHLVELHGGTIGAESPGVSLGSTFVASFPLIATRLESPFVAHSGEHACDDLSPLSGLRVLVVDDEPDACQLMSHLITRTGAEVKTCGSAHEALELLQQWLPDVLMSDIAMPDEDGYSLINKVRALPPERGGHTPAAAFTAYAREEDRERALAAGYQMHVAKPISSGQLVASLAHLAATRWGISSFRLRGFSFIKTSLPD